MGWDEKTKYRRLHLVRNNVHYLILPWVRVPAWVRKGRGFRPTVNRRPPSSTRFPSGQRNPGFALSLTPNPGS